MSTPNERGDSRVPPTPLDSRSQHPRCRRHDEFTPPISDRSVANADAIESLMYGRLSAYYRQTPEEQRREDESRCIPVPETFALLLKARAGTLDGAMPSKRKRDEADRRARVGARYPLPPRAA